MVYTLVRVEGCLFGRLRCVTNNVLDTCLVACYVPLLPLIVPLFRHGCADVPPPFTEFAPPEVHYEEPVRAVRTIAAQIAL